MKLIGIDYGTKKVGLALSSIDGTLAFPVDVIPQTTAVEYVDALAKKEKVTEIVIGESQDFHMEDNPVMKHARIFAKKLESLGYTIHFEPEFMSSMQASHIQGYNKKQDASAAAIVLQSYLDTYNNKKI